MRTKDQIVGFVRDTTKFQELMINLAERWEEEKEYEDIGEYMEAIEKELPEVSGATTDPFGVFVKCADGLLKINVYCIGDRVSLMVKEI